MLTIKIVIMAGTSLVFDLTKEQLEKLKEDLLNVAKNQQNPKESAVCYMNSFDVMRKYKISKRTLSRWISEGLPYIKSRPNVFIEQDVEKFTQRIFIRKK